MNFGKGMENQGKEGREGDFFPSSCLVCFMYLFCFVFILGKGERVSTGWKSTKENKERNEMSYEVIEYEVE